jgi:hypothetical protein
MSSFNTIEYRNLFDSDPRWIHLVQSDFIVAHLFQNAKASDWPVEKFINECVFALKDRHSQLMESSLKDRAFAVSNAFIVANANTLTSPRFIRRTISHRLDL